MNKVKKNILSNVIGKFWNIVSNFIFVPVYLKLLGLEGYSIISFSVVIAGIMMVLDVGLSASLSREFARDETSGNKWKVFLTLESIYFIISLLVILSILLFSEDIANKWLKLTSYSPELVAGCIKVLGIGVAFQLLSSFYYGGLMGLEMQVKANVIQIIYSFVKSALLIIPIYYHPSILLYFSWQAISTILYCIVLRTLLRKNFSDAGPVFRLGIDRGVLKKIYKFAGGVLLIAFVSAINTQLDRITISKLFPIEQLGYYNLSMSIAQGIIFMIIPISTAILPRFTYFVSQGDNLSVYSLFNKSFKFVLMLSITTFSVLLFNTKSALWIWTGNENIAEYSSTFLPWLMLGTLGLCLQLIPYNIAIAHGYTKVNNTVGIISLIITIPGYIIASNFFGTLGAAIIYGLVQFSVFPIYMFLIKKRFLESINLTEFIIKNFLIPMSVALGLSFLFSQFNLLYQNRIYELVRLFLIFVIILSCMGALIFRIKNLSSLIKTIKQ